VDSANVVTQSIDTPTIDKIAESRGRLTSPFSRNVVQAIRSGRTAPLRTRMLIVDTRQSTLQGALPTFNNVPCFRL